MTTKAMISWCWMGLILAGLACGAVWAAEEKTSTGGTGDPYPLATCPVSGEKLGGMGDPVIENINGREVRFCCAGCIAKYKANPGEFEKKIDAAIVEQQKPIYPLDTCVVSGEKMGGSMGEPVEYVYKNRLVRFCCKGCIGDFEKDPGKYLAALDKAAVEKQKPTYPLGTCVVSGEKLGGAAEKPVDVVLNNRLFRFCCPSCVEKVKKDPLKYTKMLDDARKAKPQEPKK